MVEPRLRLGRREQTVGALILFLTLLASCVDVSFLSTTNLRDLVVRSAPTAIISCGVMLIVVTGEIDISVGSLMALLAAILGLTVSSQQAGWPCAAGIGLVLVVGTCFGWLTGFLVTVGRVPSIMVTLGLLTSLRGITTLLMRRGNIQGLPESLQWWTKQGPLSVPLSVWTALGVVATTAWIIHRTALGRRIFALGSNRRSALMAGLPEGHLKRFAFAYTGFLTALATVVDVPRLPQIEAGIGNGLELLVVTCVVVGGVAIAGGRGTLTGVILAVFLMTIIRPVLTFLAVGEAAEKWTRAIQGVLILLAVINDHRWWRPTRKEDV